MNDWYIDMDGRRWRLCRIVSNVLGMATVELYTGEPAKGRARKGLYGWLVDAT